jgi:HD-GYP domain-containing protein (c-di-GMP phosphodiesterase class II)
MAVVDSYDAMTSDRTYRKALSQEHAINELTENAGTQFDPKIVKVFIKILRKEMGVK